MVSIPKPRKSGPAREPIVGPVKVGEPWDQVTVGLKDGKVWVNAFGGAGVTVKLTLAEAAQLQCALGALLRTAANGETG